MNRQTGQNIWLPFLLAINSKVIAITGSGGKTSLLYYLAKLLKLHGQKVIISLTTKMFHPCGDDHQVLFVDSVDALIRAVGNANSGLLTVARAIDPTDPRKLKGLPPDWFDQAQSVVPEVFFLIEADGSAGKSLKGYLDYEPVIPAAATLVIPVIGLDVLGKPLHDQYVHRAVVAAKLCGRQINDVVTTDMLVTLLQSPAGYRRGIPPTAKTVIFLNKAETSASLAAANCIADQLLTDWSTAVVFGSVRDNNFLLKTCEFFSSR